MAARPGSSSYQQLEINGIPVFWLPDSRRRMASLQFRVGRSDESFTQMGITHVVEHLAFFGLGRPQYHVNGFVDNIRTVFHASGTETDIVEFLNGIVAALRALPLDRLADESRILRTEAIQRTASLWEQLAWYRYGAVGQGSLALPEFGLGSLSREAVARWSSEWFTAGNAAVWIAGPIPNGLRLDLPPGTRRPVPAAVEIPGLPLPAWAPHRIPGIALGVVVPRETPATMANRILTKRLERHLRYELGRSYEVSVAYQPLDALEGHASIFASCLDEHADNVRAAFLATLDQFAHRGPTDEEVGEDRSQFVRVLEDPDAGYGEIERATHSELVGHPRDTAADLLAEMDATSPAEVRTSFVAALDRSIMIGPLTSTPDGLSSRQWRAYPVWSSSAVAGTRFDRAARKYPWSARTEQLRVGPDGVSWLNATGHAMTVRYADCVGLVVGADGARGIHGRDGFSVRVHPADWRKGDQAVAAVEAGVPPELIVRLPPS